MESSSYIGNCVIPTTWIDIPLLSITPYNHDTSIFTFGLPQTQHFTTNSPPNCPPISDQLPNKLNLSTCSCLLLLAPNCDENGNDAIRPYTPISDSNQEGSFDLLIKRYDQWGQKCEANTIFSFFSYNVTQHAYKPKGLVSNYLFERKVGDFVKFKYIRENMKIQYPFLGVKTITMIAVGVGIAPMIQALHELCRPSSSDDTQICLLYGVRTAADILLKEKLEEWAFMYPDRFRIIYCVGSRWAGIHMAANRKEEHIPPPPPLGYEELSSTLELHHQEGRVNVSCELGWVNEEKILKYGFPPSNDTRVFVCGLPGVYIKLCGPRTTRVIPPDTALYNLGYTEDMVVKF